MQVTPILCLTLAAVGFTRTLPAQMLDFQGMAKAAVEQFGLEDADPSTFDFDLFVDDKFLRCRLGLFDLAIPAHEATDKDVAEDFKVLAQALLDAQGQFLTWVETEDADFKQLRSDIKTVASFVKSWRAATLSKLAKDGGCDLLSALEPKEDVSVAAKRFAAAMGLGAPLGLQRDDQVREPVLVMPTRGLFVEFIAMCGWLRPELQSIFWQPAIEHWTNFYLDDYKVLALELAAAGDGGYRSATDMNKRTPNGMAQQVVQLSTNSLIDNYFADRIPAAFAGGLAINLVIDLYGECNTRADGDLTERRTQAIEVFIPGGNS